MDTQSTLSNWRRAADELGFEFESPFVLKAGDRQLQYFGHLPQFGSKRGMLVFLEWDEELAQVAQAAGFGYSCVSIHSDGYDGASFVEMLNDWQWTSKERPPLWYTGKSWTA